MRLSIGAADRRTPFHLGYSCRGLRGGFVALGINIGFTGASVAREKGIATQKGENLKPTKNTPARRGNRRNKTITPSRTAIGGGEGPDTPPDEMAVDVSGPQSVLPTGQGTRSSQSARAGLNAKGSGPPSNSQIEGRARRANAHDLRPSARDKKKRETWEEKEESLATVTSLCLLNAAQPPIVRRLALASSPAQLPNASSLAVPRQPEARQGTG